MRSTLSTVRPTRGAALSRTATPPPQTSCRRNCRTIPFRPNTFGCGCAMLRRGGSPQPPSDAQCAHGARTRASGRKIHVHEGALMLELQNVHVAVNGAEIIKGVSLGVPAGEVHALMGPNG